MTSGKPSVLNPFTSGILYFFRTPVRDYFQWKFRKKWYDVDPANQINASFIDISRIKWLVFLLWSSFFCTTSTVASSEAPADYRPAPGRTDGVPERHQRQWIINPSLQICAFTNLCVFPRTPRNTGVYTRHPTFVTATSGVLTRLPAKLSKNAMRVQTSADRRSKIKLRV